MEKPPADDSAEAATSGTSTENAARSPARRKLACFLIRLSHIAMHVIFYEKPGCAGNAKQKALLRAAGHTLEVRDLLRWPWGAMELVSFLGALPVSDWFNRAAPRIKSGAVVPEQLSATQAIELLLAEPLLIRRPLMQLANGERMVGFDTDRVHAWLGLGPQAPLGRSLEGCASGGAPSHEAESQAPTTD